MFFDGHKNSTMHYARLVLPTNTSLPSGSDVTLTLNDTTDVQYYDPFGLRTSTTDLTIKSPGVYIVVLNVLFNPPNTTSAAVGTWRSAAIHKNSVQEYILRIRPNLDGDFSSAVSGMYTMELATGDVLNLVARYQGTGTITAGSGPYTYLAVQQVTKGTS